MPVKDDLMEEMLSNTDDSEESNDSTESVAVETESSVEAQPVDEDAILAEFDTIDEITVEHLRKLPGASAHTDEELEAMWQAAQTPPKPRSYKFYKEDAEVADLQGLSAEDLLNMQFGYTAMGKEQRRNLDEIIRNAQMGHFQEARYQQIMSDRNSVYEKYQNADKQLSNYANDRKLLEYALMQYTQGNEKPLGQLIDAFKQQAAALPEIEQQQAGPDYQAEAEGQRVYYEVIVPQAYQIAQQYGANAQEIANAIVQMVQNEPEEFLTQERFQQILTVEIPYLLEQNGYAAKQQAAAKDEVGELKKELAALKAGQKNAAVTAAKKKVPPSGQGSTPSGGDTLPEIKNRQQMKDYLRS
jgi:hypothetical protein